MSIAATARAVTPTGVERRMATEALIVSKTDLKGHMTYVNRTFVEMSHYSEDQLLGQPHNLIRHPDMPRSVFKLLWDTLAARQEIFAYVVNLAADGAHYWVLAHVTPSFGDRGEVLGYHSSRRAPTRAALAQIIPVYQQLKAVEDAQPTARAATEAGFDAMVSVLSSLGKTYDEFVWGLINLKEPQ